MTQCKLLAITDLNALGLILATIYVKRFVTSLSVSFNMLLFGNQKFPIVTNKQIIDIDNGFFLKPKRFQVQI